MEIVARKDFQTWLEDIRFWIPMRKRILNFFSFFIEFSKFLKPPRFPPPPLRIRCKAWATWTTNDMKDTKDIIYMCGDPTVSVCNIQGHGIQVMISRWSYMWISKHDGMRVMMSGRHCSTRTRAASDVHLLAPLVSAAHAWYATTWMRHTWTAWATWATWTRWKTKKT